MTAATYSQPNRSGAGYILFFVAFVACLILVLSGLSYFGNVVYHGHATQRHGAEAEAVRFCQQNNAPAVILKKEDSDRYHCLFVMPDSRIGDMIVQFDPLNGQWHEITSFIRAENDLDAVITKLIGTLDQIIVP